MLDWENAKGAPLTAAIIVLLAIVALGGISLAFQGNVQF
jgi:hypothetical protein